MIEFAWYLGIIGNSFLSLFLFIVSAIILKSVNKTDLIEKGKIWFICSVLCFVVVLISIIVLYFESYVNQDRNILLNPISPLIMWIGNLFFFGLLYLMSTSVIHYKKIQQIIPFVIYSVLGLINGIFGLANYEVYWNNGNVLVYYIDKNAELINSVLNILIIILSFYFVTTTIFDQKYIDKEKLDITRLILISLGLLFGLLIFLTPRTESWSVIDSVSVKIVFYFLFSIFISILVLGWLYNKKLYFFYYNLSKKEIFVEISQYYSQLSFEFNRNKMLLKITALFSVILFLSLIGYWKLVEPYIIIYEFADQAVSDGAAFFIGEFFNIKWYVHIIGTIIPVFFALIVLLYQVISKKRNFYLLFFTLIFISQTGLSFILNNMLNLGRRTNVFTPFILGFIFPIIIILILNFLYFNKFFDYSEFSSKNILLNIINLSLLLPIYSATIFSTILTDFLNPSSETGKILVGAGGVIDGIFLIPLFNSVLSVIITLIIIFVVIEIVTNKISQNIPVNQVLYETYFKN
jgi:hypothetical protein